MNDYLKVLGIQELTDHSALKRAYRKKALHVHPDRNRYEKSDYFIKVKQAYQCLLNTLEEKPIPGEESSYNPPPEKSYAEYLEERKRYHQQEQSMICENLRNVISSFSTLKEQWFFDYLVFAVPLAILLMKAFSILIMLTPITAYFLGYSRLLILLIVPLVVLGILLFNFSCQVNKAANQLMDEINNQ
jgi:curved DNA-binding protein CbpA